MCSNDNSTTALVPYSLKSLTDPNCAAAAAYMSLNPNLTQAALEHYRLQLYNYASYADRFRYTHPALASHFALAASPYGPPGHHQTAMAGHHEVNAFAAALSPYAKFDPRGYRVQEEPKPQHSYIGLIGMAILSSPDKKLVLSDIYQYILDNYAYFRSRGPGWRNSIRHNLSLNDCFIKAGRSANGKGHYWAIHPANIEDFKKGDFRRRKAQRRVRKHMGLAVPDDEDSSSPPPPGPAAPNSQETVRAITHNSGNRLWSDANKDKPDSTTSAAVLIHTPGYLTISRRRQFDMESLLAPDNPAEKQSGPTRLVHVLNSAGTAQNGYQLGTLAKITHRQFGNNRDSPPHDKVVEISEIVEENVEDSCSEVVQLASEKSNMQDKDSVEEKDKDPKQCWDDEDGMDSCLSDDTSSHFSAPICTEHTEEAAPEDSLQVATAPTAACSVVGLSTTGRPNLCSSTISSSSFTNTTQLSNWQKTFLCNSLAIRPAVVSNPLNYALASSCTSNGSNNVPTAVGNIVENGLQGLGSNYIQIPTSLLPVTGASADAINAALNCERRQHFDRVDHLRRMSMSSI